jgi:hypothetical protein
VSNAISDASDDAINRLFTESFTSEPTILTRIIVDEYALCFVTPQFTCESYEHVTLHSQGGAASALSADFRKRDAGALSVFLLVGKEIKKARVDKGQLTLLFETGEQIIFGSRAGCEGFVITFTDGRGIYLFSGIPK